MPSEVDPKTFQLAVIAGYKRLKNFRDARLMFIRNYVGQYYDQSSGEIGAEALNMIFNAIRVLVPNLVMQRPTHRIRSKYLQTKEYAELLEMAIGQQDKELRIDRVYREVIVDAIFTLGILKTGLAASGTVYALDEYDQVDMGSIYTERVSFDNLIIDPLSREHLFRDAAFIGDKTCVPRKFLLESGLYDNELIEKLPAIGTASNKPTAADTSRNSIKSNSDAFMLEEVEIAELWLPNENTLVTVPGDEYSSFDKYLRTVDYYGPDTGPYTFLALTPSVPDNPIPVPSVGIWNDLHILTNKMSKKVINQALNQRDILAYRRGAADDAEELVNAEDGDAIAVEDPSSMQTLSFGGQKQSNEAHLAGLMNWFNMMSANSEALAGQRTDADSATEARILASNAAVGLEDQRGLVYEMSAEEASKRAWYLHTDPFINLPLIRRVEIPAQFEDSGGGPQMVSPPSMQDQQVMLTPEARSGDFLDFHFEIVPESMTKLDSQTRFQKLLDFSTRIMPAAIATAQSMLLLGQPFSVKDYIIRMAKEDGIDWLHEVFFDPQYQQSLMLRASMLPQMEQSKGQPGGQQQPSMGAGMSGNMAPIPGVNINEMLQNGQPGRVAAPAMGPESLNRQQSQQGAVPDQQAMAYG